MAKITRKKTPRSNGDWVVRSTTDGRIITQKWTKKDSEGRARFLAAASLSAVPKKSKLTQAQAKRVVEKFFTDTSKQVAEA